jgi:antitoxin component of RelBE/YafQ-DinJ toxin-antitoxin module
MTIPEKTTLIKVYIPKTLRKEFKQICKDDGIAMSARVELFILRLIEKRAKQDN